VHDGSDAGAHAQTPIDTDNTLVGIISDVGQIFLRVNQERGAPIHTHRPKGLLEKISIGGCIAEFCNRRENTAKNLLQNGRISPA
jgi:hypothetical protein